MPTDWSKIGDFAVKVGVPSVIAIYLVWILTQGLSQDMAAMKASFDQHSSQAAMMMQQYEQVRIQSDRQLYVMQRICINSANTPQERQECLAK